MSELQFLHSVKKIPFLALPVCTVVVPLKNARVLVSPGSMLSREELRSAGEVTDIVAPSLLHTGGVARAAEVFPKAKIWGPVGVAKAKPKIKWNAELTETAWPYGDELALVHLAGLPSYGEVVFVDKTTRTLIVTDFAFNICDPEGVGAWIIFKLFGTYKKFAVSRLFASGVKDTDAFEKSLGKVFAHDFERVVVSHGVPEERGREKLLASLRERGFTPRP